MSDLTIATEPEAALPSRIKFVLGAAASCVFVVTATVLALALGRAWTTQAR